MQIDQESRTSRNQTHLFFWGSIYSQWQKARFSEDGISYNSAEQYMMAMKARQFQDAEAFDKIMAAKDPREQKAIGRTVKGFDSKVWDKVAFDHVVQANRLKFAQNPQMKAALLATGDLIIVEGSPYDTIWGVGLMWDDPAIEDPANWKGQNLLGEALMKVRSELNQEAGS